MVASHADPETRMTSTPRLALPHLYPAQAQKHLTVNAALERLDASVQASVLDVADVPPDGVVEGEAYRVGDAPEGGFADHAGEVAMMGAGGWVFVAPTEGFTCWNAAQARLEVFADGAWGALETQAPDTVERLGVGTGADPNHALSVRGGSTLLDAGGGGSHRLVMNRADSASTASLLMQTGYSGQAEIGLTGDGDFRVRVSADGSTWRDALSVDTATGAVALPGTQMAGATDMRRVVLTVGSGTYTVPDGVVALHVEVQGAGGGGAGAETPDTSVFVGAGGGGGGGCAVATIGADRLADTYAWSVGAGGAGGAAGAGAATGARSGTDGGDTTFSGGTVSLTGQGGRGASEAAPSATHRVFSGGAGGTASGGELNLPGSAGGSGLTAMRTYYQMGDGRGGSARLGQGASYSNSNGRDGSRHGGGGAGAGMIPGVALNRSGGNGAPGVIVIVEVYG